MSKQDELSHVIRCVEHYGTVIGNRTINEHWIVNGVRFNHMPSESEVEEAYTRPTPQADEVKRLEEAIKHAADVAYSAAVDEFEKYSASPAQCASFGWAVKNAVLAIDAMALSHKEEADKPRPDLDTVTYEHHWQRPDGSIYVVDSSD